MPSPRARVIALTVSVALVGLGAASPASNSATAAARSRPTCHTPVASDRFEPPCNPYLASPIWSGSHRNSYAQASSPYPGPLPGDDVTVDHMVGVFGAPVILDFTDTYPDGGRNVWFSSVSVPDGRYTYKVDAQTNQIIDRYGFENEPEPPERGGVSGAYSVLDRANHLIVGRARALDVYGDEVPGDRFSPIAHLKRLAFPARAFCGPEDKLVGITMLFDGRIAFATQLGMVGTLPRALGALRAKNIRVTSINGHTACASATADDASLDQVSNSIAADSANGIYVVTSKAMYRFDWNGTTVERRWRSPYETGVGGGVRLGDGSGSTPTLMGIHSDQDRFVVITDGQDLMHLDLFWRGRIPHGWKGLPGKSRRLACEIPVTFGDSDAKVSASEQSVLVRGYASVVVNNKLKDETAINALPKDQRFVAAALAGGDPNNAPYGIERFDWNPRTQACTSTWANTELSIPNGIPTMSTSSGLIYAIGQRSGTWGLEGIDFETGVSEMWVPTSPSPDNNAAYAATTVGPGGDVWTGTLLGYSVFRGPDRP